MQKYLKNVCLHANKYVDNDYVISMFNMHGNNLKERPINYQSLRQICPSHFIVNFRRLVACCLKCDKKCKHRQEVQCLYSPTLTRASHIRIEDVINVVYFWKKDFGSTHPVDKKVYFYYAIDTTQTFKLHDNI